jgi:hypothetical protein
MATDLAHPSELGLPIVEKCHRCNFYPWIDFAQDTYRETVGKLLNSQRSPRRRKKDDIV